MRKNLVDGYVLAHTGSYHSIARVGLLALSLTVAGAQLVANLVALIPAICNRIFHVLFRCGAYRYISAIGVEDKKTVSQVHISCCFMV